MFSLSWFTTIPGLLITGGVLLLVIAFVIFIVTSKKDKKAAAQAASDGSVSPTVPTVQVMDSQSGVTASTIPGDINSVVQPNVVSVTPQPTSVVEPSPVNVEMPTATFAAIPEVHSNGDFAQSADLGQIPEPISTPNPSTDAFSNIPQVPNIDMQGPSANMSSVSAPIGESVAIPPVDSTPTVSVSDAVSPVVSPVENTIPAPSVEQVIPEMQDVGAPTITVSDPYVSSSPEVSTVSPSVVPTVEQGPVSIYGGSSPVVPNISTPETHQIYGGVSPLENTQSVSISDITNGIYTANNNVASVQPEPVATSSVAMPTPVEEVPTITYPSVDQQVPSSPVITPDVSSTYSYQSPATSDPSIIGNGNIS